MSALAISIGTVGAAAALLLWSRRRRERVVAQDRLAYAQLAGERSLGASAAPVVPDATVARWLFLAGFRAADAATRFWRITIAMILLGVGFGLALEAVGVSQLMIGTLAQIPGDVGLLFVPVVELLPVILAFFFGAIPAVHVRRKRRERVRALLADLYPVLELFASLAQAGLAFDAALARVLTTLGPDRPLGRELMAFQAEVMSGADRPRCFRRLAQRIDLLQMSSFTSALIRAHEAGIGLASTLRRQADDLRTELREQALARAQSLPARLVFPLVICFLPGVFVMSLGPAFYGFLVDTSDYGTTR